MKNETKITFPVGMRIMKYIDGKNHISLIAKKMDVTYTHVSKQISHLKKINFIKIKRKGRCNYIELTKTGKEYADNIIKAMNVYNNSLLFSFKK